MDLAAYRRWLSVARRSSRRADEAEDLLQESLLAAIRQGRGELSSEAEERWFSAVIRKQAAMAARGAARRRRRESLVEPDGAAPEAERERPPVDGARLLDDLPPAARRVAALAYWRSGSDQAEMAFGPIRRALAWHLRSAPGVGTTDPDGHLLVIREREGRSRIRRRRQQRGKD